MYFDYSFLTESINATTRTYSTKSKILEKAVKKCLFVFLLFLHLISPPKTFHYHRDHYRNKGSKTFPVSMCSIAHLEKPRCCEEVLLPTRQLIYIKFECEGFNNKKNASNIHLLNNLSQDVEVITIIYYDFITDDFDHEK